jgi:xanthine dehydrogenase accessory factor
MNKKINIWKFILNGLQQHVPVALLYVLESRGSSPGRQGFFMAVDATGNMQGSIGGGIMEHKLVELAKERLSNNVDSAQQFIPTTEIKKQVHDPSVARNRSGMICAGEQTVLIHMVREGDAAAITELIRSLEANNNGCLFLSAKGIGFSTTSPDEDFKFELRTETDWSYREKTGYKQQLFIIGGGHCALALSTIMKEMDFYIRLYEERAGLNTLLQNEQAHEKILVNDYSLLNDLIHSDASSYVVIMTVGFRTDDLVLHALRGKQFRYLGLLGSKSKIEKMFTGLSNEGFAPEELEKIHAPAGLDIKSETPEEIAVSIAAEIIRVKNKG